MRTSLLMAACSAVLLSACGGGTKPLPARTIVAGQVINRSADDPGVMTWNLCDPIVDERLGARLYDDGSFRFETDGITCLHNATLNYGEFINFFVAPGDSVWLEIDASRLKNGSSNAARFGGAHAEDNAQLYAVVDYLYGRLYSYPEPLDATAPAGEVIAQIKERTGQASDSLEAYTQRKGIVLSDNVRDFLDRDMVFVLANELLDYRRDDPAAQLALYSDPLFGLHDMANFQTMMFPYHLGAYMQTKVGADTAVMAAGERGDFAAAARGGIRVLSEEPATRSRDVMMWQYLSDIADYFPPLCDSVPEVKTAFLDPSLTERLVALCSRFSGVPSFPDTPVNGVAYLTADNTVVEVPEGDVFAYLAAKYPGKVLYVDVYATWCGPCRVEMKEAPALHGVMRGKDAVFVNLCLASDRDAWLQTVAQQKLEGENYWFDRDATTLFMGSYNLSGYPTYILVGRDGKIATMKAERPSALTQVSKRIDDLLAK